MLITFDLKHGVSVALMVRCGTEWSLEPRGRESGGSFIHIAK